MSWLTGHITQGQGYVAWNIRELFESVEADIFTIIRKHYPFIVDYHSKSPVMNQVKKFSIDSLIKTCEIIFSECGLPSKIISDTDTNFISEKFENFCKCSALNMQCHHNTAMGTMAK